MSSLYPKLAFQNIRKNGKYYFPYLLTCIGTVMMFYIICFIASNEGIKEMPGADSLTTMMGFGTIVIALFAVIFMFYTNSFLIKRRKKELGLYNILGMEKRHISKILFYESFYIFFVGVLAGLILGVVFSKLSLMIIGKLLNLDSKLAFSISSTGVIFTVALFAGIFILTLISDLTKIRLSNPIELLHGDRTGEREPKTKWIMTIIGLICIGIGYYIGITTDSPLEAFALFFVAVILVIIGTYFLFVAGSIALLKMLRKNKNYYYKISHFTGISGMIYRMKQNAVGLGNICILSTMVLVIISTTVCLDAGAQQALDYRFPNDIFVSKKYVEMTDAERDKIVNMVKNTYDEKGRTPSKFVSYTGLSFSAANIDGKFSFDHGNNVGVSYINALCFYTAADYNAYTGKSVHLAPTEVLVKESELNKSSMPENFDLFGKTYSVVGNIDDLPFTNDYSGYTISVHDIIVSDESVLKELYNGQLEAYGDEASLIELRIETNIDGTDDEKIECYNAVESQINENYTKQDGFYYESKQAIKTHFFATYGSLLFLGVFLGLLFMMATVLIIYYKQISEGYEDKERFDIMQKVGMSRDEVKKTIHSQVLTVFFLPLITACIHLLASFHMITKLMMALNLTNVSLFAWCSVVTVVVFAAVYGIVYAITAKAYYKIVKA